MADQNLPSNSEMRSNWLVMLESVERSVGGTWSDLCMAFTMISILMAMGNGLWRRGRSQDP